MTDKENKLSFIIVGIFKSNHVKYHPEMFINIC